MIEKRPVRVVSVYARAGTQTHLPGEPEDRARVLVFHQFDEHQKHGCGFLGAFNRGGLEDSLKHFWAEIRHLNIDPEKYLGLTQTRVKEILHDLDAPNDAREYAATIRTAAEKSGLPTIIAVHGHADGSVRITGVANLGKAKGREVAVSTCSDARSPHVVGDFVANAVMNEGKNTGHVLYLPEDLKAPDPQKPSRMSIHLPEHLIVKEKGETFNITPTLELMGENPKNESEMLDQLFAKLSFLYGATHFGPLGTNSVSRIVVTNPHLYEKFKKEIDSALIDTEKGFPIPIKSVPFRRGIHK
ncbi:hypothetical protein HZC09_05870 [Candidatus Micrarchaeota archaeon]|nr:hypothetical protein [Candidatus Micrarchaeota archaeon]